MNTTLTDAQCQALAHAARPLKYRAALNSVSAGLALDGLLTLRNGRWRLTAAGEAFFEQMKGNLP